MKRSVLVVSLAAFLLPGCSRNPSATETAPKRTAQPGHTLIPSDSPQLSRIQTASVAMEEVPEVEIVAPGKVEPNPTRVSKIVMPVSGRVGRVLVNLGDTVRKGQAILTIDSPDAATAISAYRQAEANIAQARAAIAKAGADLQRVQDLFAHKAAAEKEIMAAETVVVQSKAALTQAEASRDEAAKRLNVLGLTQGNIADQVVTVRSSLSGKVIDISAVSGELRNDTSTPIVTIADLSTVWVAADVPEDQIRFSTIGAPVRITLNAYPGQTFSGKVMRIGDMVDPQSRTLKVRVELSNPGEKLRPEMFAQLRQQQGRVTLPVVPRSALIENQGRTVVYVERSRGDFEEVPVQVAWQGDSRAAIRSGIAAGDRVVTSGGMLLRSN